jgi:hypothetical protein
LSRKVAVNLIAGSGETELERLQRLAIRDAAGQCDCAVSRGVELGAMERDPCGKRAGERNLLTGESGQFGDVELGCIERCLDRA